MKNLVVVGFALSASSCAALAGLAGGETGPDPQAIGDTAGGIATALTGNPAIGIAVGTLVGGAAAWFYKRKKPATA